MSPIHNHRYSRGNNYCTIPINIVYFLFFISACLCDSKFDPYQLNGGLVAAIAGRDYVIFSSDTRLTGGGYDILSRRHISSRVWPVHISSFAHDIPVDDENKDMAPIEWDLSTQFVPHTWVVSAGCAADCEALKRCVQAELSIQQQDLVLLRPPNIATCLSNILYSRRVFPYYSFCILAGLDKDESRNGVVHIYDAIGSHERVAVACTGTGREILQPILDRLYAESSKPVVSNNINDSNKRRVVATHVSCCADDAVGLLVHGYRAASEREIQVGDSLLIGILQFSGEQEENDAVRLRFLRFPLKEH